jgi:hypothetical protein
MPLKSTTLIDMILDDCKDMTEEELRNLSELLTEKANCIRDDRIKKAKAKFIEAWREYRKVAPNDFKYVTIEDSDYDLDIDLYEYMDNYL